QGRADSILDQRQSNQDWWFQQQSQQSVQQRAEAAVRFAPSGGPPPAAMDIIKWPTVLQESCFASERTQIESPYRRTPPKLSVPTPADYGNMAGAVEDMKAVLQWKLKEGVETADYNAANTFLNELGK